MDTETSGLFKPEVADITTQPHIIEIAMVKLDDKYRELARYESLVNPGIPIDEEAHKKISKLTNADLADAPIFLEIYEDVVEFFLGERRLVAHNLWFDLGMLTTELKRIGKEFAFPYPPIGICTVETTKHLQGKRLHLPELYELKVKKKLAQKHRAMADVEALIDIVRAMKL